jgi:formamidopyrimidine-DNA glycosylase
MKGHWMFEPDQPNTHFELNFVSIDANTGLVDEEVRLFYVNSRFGEFNIFTTQQQLIDALDRLAPGFIGRFPITKEYWMERFSTFNDRLIRGILMDQKILCSGVGNYLLAEILYYARLYPDITTRQLSVEMISHLYDVCLYVITGHYRKTLEKVIYNRKICPNGHTISRETRGSRPMFFCAVEQTILQ